MRNAFRTILFVRRRKVCLRLPENHSTYKIPRQSTSVVGRRPKNELAASGVLPALLHGAASRRYIDDQDDQSHPRAGHYRTSHCSIQSELEQHSTLKDIHRTHQGVTCRVVCSSYIAKRFDRPWEITISKTFPTRSADISVGMQRKYLQLLLSSFFKSTSLTLF